MDNLGSEVGQKMRSAVKAKLLELGTGGSAGYIDDELPDYVMIMVANKRSKQQMTADLNLFLGSQTELFVTWLHEVLQKLQEVTLPALALQKKRKNSQKEEAASNKKDKKEKKKDKKAQKKSTDPETAEITSITEVFAGEFFEKAKKTFEYDTSVVKDKKQEHQAASNEKDGFDIPTISEISHKTDVTSESREKDLAELAEIQKKIYAAKKQLKLLDDADESEDEDFLNIKEDGEEFEDTNDLVKEKKKPRKPKSPIVFEMDHEPLVNEANDDSSASAKGIVEQHSPLGISNRHSPIEFRQRRESESVRVSASKESVPRKKSIHERLGHVSRESRSSESSHQHQRRVEKEIYVPAFRRREMEKERRDEKLNGMLETRSKRKRSVSSERIKRDSSLDKALQQRIGSRVVVAPPKMDVSNDNDVDTLPERPVNSVIKIKPRPSISPSKQACKNLLLRAVAEAQRSTILIKPKRDISIQKKSSSPTKRNTKFFTKSYRDRINRDTLLRRTAKNLVIEVKADVNRREERNEAEIHMEEYIPEHISDKGESDMELIYVPQSMNSPDHEEEEEEPVESADDEVGNKTQFVVTLNEKKSSLYETKVKTSRPNGVENNSRHGASSRNRETGDIRTRLTLNKNKTQSDRETNSSPSNNTPPRPSSSTSGHKSELINIYRKPKEVKKIVIKNDSEDDDVQSPTKESITKSHIPKEEKQLTESKGTKPPYNTEEEGSTTPPLPIRKPDDKVSDDTTINKRKRQLIKFDLTKQSKTEEIIPAKRRSKSGDRERDHTVESSCDEKHKISIKNVESKKYDNVPSSLNSVSIDSLVIKAKPKERCKYYPGCTKDTCEFFHPAAPCKSFPNCKYADKCLYVHPKCKFDLTCNRIGCNYQHSASGVGQCIAPPLSSHVVPVQNYKSISASSISTPSMCKFYPNCSKPSCPFFHPKMCRFGRNCNNKLECNFYHHDVASNKFKWVASVV